MQLRTNTILRKITLLTKTLSTFSRYVPKNTIDIYWNMPDSRIKSLEHVSVRLKYRTRYEDSINMILCSPSGTCCNILHNDTRKNNTKPFTISWTYMTVSFWGESSQGEWKLSVIVETGIMGNYESL